MKANFISSILLLADIYSCHFNYSLKTVSLRSAKRGNCFDILKNGGNITIHRVERIMQWFSDNWPDDELDWPEDINRPPPNKKEVA